MAARNREHNFYKESWEEHFTRRMMGNKSTDHVDGEVERSFLPWAGVVDCDNVLIKICKKIPLNP